MHMGDVMAGPQNHMPGRTATQISLMFGFWAMSRQCGTWIKQLNCFYTQLAWCLVLSHHGVKY